MTISTPSDINAQVRFAVDEALATFIAAQQTRATTISPELQPLLGNLADFIRGGKRLRPLFGYWGIRAAGVEPELTSADPYLRTLAALEWLHAFALIHDDIMDASDTRRGQPSAHRHFEALHHQAGWRGDAENYGRSAAILLGDLCLVWSDEAWHTGGLSAGTLHNARPYLDRMRTELMFGQYLDVVGDCVNDESSQRATTVLRYKSAKYTVEYPLLIGAALTGDPQPDLYQALSGYGLPLGEAFQLRDDQLGVFGDPHQTGKPAGDDLREGKRTLLIGLTLQRVDAESAAFVRNSLGDPALTADSVARLRTLIIESGALAALETTITDLVGQARASLGGTKMPDLAIVALDELCGVATNRSY